MTIIKLLKNRNFTQIAVLLLLLLLLVIGAVPGYLKGRWQWQEPPPVPNLKQLKDLRHTSLNIPGWQTTDQREQTIGGRKWSLQLIKKDEKTPAIVLLLPQNGPRDQPQVEWTEINGWQQWDVAQERTAEFSIPNPKASNTNIKVEARFFRGVTPQQTFAVLQWYASPTGGHPAPINWFFPDQVAQWSHKRLAWVGVCILIPIEPLGQVEQSWSLTQSLAQAVQTALIKDVF
ncbi:MAG: cyanoexosortase B system-associated protein [Nostocaceae cyanobacterium]|nr:cyanoexosortase B system-associated protein [Nostocaceae cyanobacterium]